MKYKNTTASALIKTGFGKVAGVVVNSHSSGTIKLWDNTAASGSVITDTYSFATGSQVVSFPDPISFDTGLYATIGGTANVTIVYA